MGAGRVYPRGADGDLFPSQTIRSYKAHGDLSHPRPESRWVVVIREACKRLWDFGRLASCCCWRCRVDNTRKQPEEASRMGPQSL